MTFYLELHLLVNVGCLLFVPGGDPRGSGDAASHPRTPGGENNGRGWLP